MGAVQVHRWSDLLVTSRHPNHDRRVHQQFARRRIGVLLSTAVRRGLYTVFLQDGQERMSTYNAEAGESANDHQSTGRDSTSLNDATHSTPCSNNCWTGIASAPREASPMFKGERKY